MLLFLFILGLSFGSFLNVLIDRLPQERSILGRSYCDYCRHRLSWYDLIPLLSFFLLGRKCRYCQKKISWQYPLVELISAFLFIFTYTSIIQIIKVENFWWYFGYYLMIISGLIVIFFTDLKYRIIPDEVVFVLTFLSFFYLGFFESGRFLSSLISGLANFLLFLILLIVTKGKGMGLGDVKFAFLMGLILDFPKIIVGFYLSFLTGALFSLILVIWRKKSLKSTIAFGPFLVVSTLVVLFYGEKLWEIFQKLIGI